MQINKKWREDTSEGIWKLKLDWGDLKNNRNTTINFWRSYFTRGKILELHLFVDASQSAYGAVAYYPSDGDWYTLIFSKFRVTPLRTEKKMLAIPQAEFMPSVIGTRVTSSILSEFQPLGLSPNIFSGHADSKIVLYWIKKMGKIKCQFVHIELIRSADSTRVTTLHGITAQQLRLLLTYSLYDLLFASFNRQKHG